MHMYWSIILSDTVTLKLFRYSSSSYHSVAELLARC